MRLLTVNLAILHDLMEDLYQKLSEVLYKTQKVEKI